MSFLFSIILAYIWGLTSHNLAAFKAPSVLQWRWLHSTGPIGTAACQDFSLLFPVPNNHVQCDGEFV